MKIFISHSHDEHRLAKAWEMLLSRVNPEAQPWYSSDPNPAGGVGPGDWREKIKKQIESSDAVLALFTPESTNRPWIFFECGFGRGRLRAEKVIPVVYFMDREKMPSPMQDLNIYFGDNRQSVWEVCQRLVLKPIHRAADSVDDQVRDLLLNAYEQEVEAFKEERFEESLYGGDFHNLSTAKQLEGSWYAKWSEIDDSGMETVFEEDRLEARTTDQRFRIWSPKGAKGAPYPMEGVVSSKGHVALSYWSSGTIPVCGTALLKLTGAHDVMEGFWQGFTVKRFEEGDLVLKRGRVVIGRDCEKVKAYVFPDTEKHNH